MISGTVGPGEHEWEKSAIWLASILGGKPRKLRGAAFRAVLSPDDSLIAYMNDRGLALADADGENPRQFIEAGALETLGSPRWSADGRRIVYRRATWEGGRLVTTIESRGLDESTSTVVVRDPEPSPGREVPRTWEADFLVLGDRLVYSENEPAPRGRDQNLWEVTLDPGSGRPRGEPRRLTDWVGFDIVTLSATADGSQLVFGNIRTQEDVYVGDLGDGGWSLTQARRLTLDDRDDRPACWTPDGSVVFRSDRYGSGDLFVQGLDERAPGDLVLGAGEQSEPRLTPDRSAFLYWETARTQGARQGDSKRLLRVPVGGGPTELVYEAHGLATFDCATTRDGPCVLIEARLDKRTSKLSVTLSRLDPVKGKGEELWHLDVDPSGDSRAALSPDGSRLAVIGHTKGARSIRLTDALSGEILRDIEVSGVTGVELRDVAWSPDGTGFYLAGDTARGAALLRVDLQGRAQLLQEDPTADFSVARPSPDGRHLAFGKATWDANAWMIEKF